MEKDKFNHYLKTLSKAFNIPIAYGQFTGGITHFEPFDITTEENGLDYIVGKIKPVYNKFSEENVLYFVTSDLILMGVVFNRSTNEFVFVGPIASHTTTEKEVENYLKKVNLSEDTTYKLAKYMLNVKPLDQNSLIELLSNVNLILNDEIRPSHKIVAAYDSETLDRIAFAYNEYNIETIKQDKLDAEHAANYKLSLNYFILDGDIEGLADFLERTEDPLTVQNSYCGNVSELKVMAFSRIFTAETIALKSGIPSVDLEETQRYYLRKINSVSNEEDLKNLITNATIDFAKLVKNYLDNKTDNPTINRAVTYIKNNITVKLTADDIAKAIKANKRYLFTRFKKETGKTLIQFVNEEKIKKSCYYLQFTDKSLAEIANFLSFSSQSYFQAVFKSIVGQTPTDWRKNNRYFK
ncbi:MAG: AraC family transcriptional regulator [Clostridia bacterium]|nr:AraC family transcriptional regulator [Clostridia bacterium]